MLTSFEVLSRRLIRGAVALTMLSAARRGLDAVAGVSEDSSLFRLTRFFDVVIEGTLPTWYSSVLLLIAAALVWHVLRIGWELGSRSVDLWYLKGLVVGLVYLSIDETAEIHEQLTGVIQGNVDVGGSALQYSWVLVAIPVVLVVAAAYTSWIARLPGPVRRLIIAGGALYVFGAIGLEIASSQSQFGLGSQQLAAVLGHAEELCEMLGVVLFIEAMMRYLTDVLGWDGVLRFAVRSRPRVAAASPRRVEVRA